MVKLILRINLSFSGEALITLIPHVRECPFSPVKSLLKGAHHFAKPHPRLPAARNLYPKELKTWQGQSHAHAHARLPAAGNLGYYTLKALHGGSIFRGQMVSL